MKSTVSWTACVILTLTGLMGAAACAPDEPPPPDPTTTDLLSARVAAPEGPRAFNSPTGSGPGQLPPPPSQALGLDQIGYTMGDPSAPVRILEFSDFGCGYCRKFHEETFPTLEQEYIETGKVYWKYVPMILGMFPNAMEAARAGECGGAQDRFREIQDRLFRDQGTWKKSSDPVASVEAIAAELGLDMTRYRACVAEGERDDRIATGTQLSREAGVRGTPTFFIVGYAPIPGALPLELFREVLDTAVALAARGEGPVFGGGGQ